MQPQQRTATRQVTVMEAATETRTENYIEMVSYTETIQVPVSAGYGGCGYAGYAPGYGVSGGCCH